MSNRRPCWIIAPSSPRHPNLHAQAFDTTLAAEAPARRLKDCPRNAQPQPPRKFPRLLVATHSFTNRQPQHRFLPRLPTSILTTAPRPPTLTANPSR